MISSIIYEQIFWRFITWPRFGCFHSSRKSATKQDLLINFNFLFYYIKPLEFPMGCKQLKSEKHTSHAMRKLLTWETHSFETSPLPSFYLNRNKPPHFHFEATLNTSLTASSYKKRKPILKNGRCHTVSDIQYLNYFVVTM